jgi:ABC-2 type transport system permease protein
MDKNMNKKEQQKEEAMGKKNVRQAYAGSKRGMYTAAVSALVFALIIVFNLIVGGLPSGMLEFDISEQKAYSVSEQSVDYLKTLDKDISIVLLAQDKTVDERLIKFLNNYARLSSRITLKIVDPVLDPTALTTYSAEENSVVVSCAATNKTKLLNLIGFSGYTEGLVICDPTTYQYYQQLQPVSLDAEGLLTSAIYNVASDATNKIYLLKGHGESEFGSLTSSLLAKTNYDIATLDLLTDGSIPEDCKLIICNNPQADLNDDELGMLTSYLRNGGKVLLFLERPDFSNYNALLTVYGLQMQTGVVADKERYYKKYAEQYGMFCIYPVLSTTSEITAAVETNAILVGANGMIQVTPQRSNAVITPFMTTSDNAALFVDEEHYTEGQYILGATAVETFAEQPDVQTRLTVITDVDILSDSATSDNFSNMEIFMNAVKQNFTEVRSFVIPARSLEVEPTNLGESAAWGGVLIGAIPVVLLGGGIVYWVRRRNR